MAVDTFAELYTEMVQPQNGGSVLFSRCVKENSSQRIRKGLARYIYFYGNGNWSFVYFTFRSAFSLSGPGWVAIEAGCPQKKRGLKPTETSCISHSFNGIYGILKERV